MSPLFDLFLIKGFINAKWMIIRPYYIMNWITYAFLLVIFALMVGYGITHEDNVWYFWSGYTITIIQSVYLLSREILQMLSSKRAYIQLENFMDWAVIVPTVMYLILILQNKEMALNIGYWAILLGCINLTFYMGEFPLFGTIIHVIFSVTVTLIFMIILVLPMLGGFTLFFHFISYNYQKTNVNVLHQFGRSVLNTVSMMLGNIEIQEITENVNDMNSTKGIYFRFALILQIYSLSQKDSKLLLG